MPLINKVNNFTVSVLILTYSTVSLAGNGCGTGWNTSLIRDSYGGANFSEACDHHDTCYEVCGKTKQFCDKALRSRMKAECRSTFHKRYERIVKNACLKISDIYYEGTKKAGENAWVEAQAHCSLEN